MNRKFLASSILVLLTSAVYCQDSLRYQSKWQVRPSFGITIPLTNLLKGDETDYLMAFDDQLYYCQVLSASYFFHKHWGVEFDFQISSSSSIRHRDDKFTRYVQSEYGNDYYVSPSTGANFDDSNVLSGDIQRGYLGLVYRLESNRFFIYPKFLIGVTSFYTDWGKAYLKEKNSNRVVMLHYSPSRMPNDHFTIASSVTAGYKLTKRVFLSVDVLASHYKTDITFVKTTTDLNSGETLREENAYKTNVFSLAVGAGLIIVIK